MTDDQGSDAQFQLRPGQVIRSAVVIGIVGGLLALAASALAGSAAVEAVRRRLEQMDPPPAMARQGLARAKAATSARVDAWRNGQLATPPESGPESQR